MSKKHVSPKPRQGIQKITGQAAPVHNAMNALAREVLQTREVRHLVNLLITECLTVWSGSSWMKKTVSKPINFMVNKQLTRSEDILGDPELALLFEDEAFVKRLFDVLPGLVNGIQDAVCTSMESLEHMAPDEKTRLIKDLIGKVAKGKAGQLITGLARVLNHIHAVDPEFLAHAMEPSVQKFFKAMDFGEVKEAVDGAVPCVLAFVSMVNEVIWQYPSKVVGLLSLLPPVVKTVFGSAGISLKRLNRLPPDLMTDIVIALLGEIDSTVIGELIDETMEVGRKLHTGSALLGEPGSPRLPRMFSAKLEEIIAHMDPSLFWKGRLALAEVKAAFDDALSGVEGLDEDRVALAMKRKAELKSIRMRTRNRKLAIMDGMDDETLAVTLNQGLEAYDVQEAADTFNTLVRTLNRLMEQTPESVAGMTRQMVQSVDTGELAGLAEMILTHSGEDLKPLARCVVPRMVIWACELLQPADDEFEDDAARARDALKSLFMAEEV